MFRLLGIALLCLGAAVWVEPDWNKETRTVRLRLRTPDEVVQDLRDRSRDFGARLVRTAREGRRDRESSVLPPPEVGARGEHITQSEAHELEQLIRREAREE